MFWAWGATMRNRAKRCELTCGYCWPGWLRVEVVEILVKRQPSGRLGTPEDVARLVSFLLSDDGSWTTGELSHTDGGFSS